MFRRIHVGSVRSNVESAYKKEHQKWGLWFKLQALFKHIELNYFCNWTCIQVLFSFWSIVGIKLKSATLLLFLCKSIDKQNVSTFILNDTQNFESIIIIIFGFFYMRSLLTITKKNGCWKMSVYWVVYLSCCRRIIWFQTMPHFTCLISI